MLKRLFVFVGIILALGVVVWGLTVFLRSYGASDAPSSQPDAAPEVFGQLPEAAEPIPNDESESVVVKPPVSPEELEQAQAAVFAKDFAARLATYSNQNRSSNIEELLPETSGTARKYLESLLDESRYQSEYIGVTSRALAARWLKWNPDGESTVIVGLWRVETRNDEERGTAQDLELSFRNFNGSRVVTEIRWKEPKQSPL